MVADLTPLKNVTGKEAEISLERAGLTCNKNAIPNDPRSPFVTSGLRFGTPASTTRGFKENEFILIGNMIADVLNGYVNSNSSSEINNNHELEQKIKNEVKNLCQKFPIY
jgi:glycine hydroxymethyltransferase